MADGSSRKTFTIAVVGPYGTPTTGSFLRSSNIWHVIKGLKGVRVIYLPITYPVEVLANLRLITSSDLIIVSGVSPWISAIIVFFSILFKKHVIIDVHGSPFYEHLMAGRVSIFRKMLFFVTEHLTYRLSSSIILASKGLLSIISAYLKVRVNDKRIYIVPNSLNYLFIKIINKLLSIDKRTLRNYIMRKLKLDEDSKVILVPLPNVFISNILAYELLRKIVNEINSMGNIKVIVTGIVKSESISKGVITTGYLPYPEYAALLLNSSAELLPYPENAVSGGVRNKVLEAGYCGVPIISTRSGVLHSNARAWIHYIPLEDTSIKDLLNVINDVGLYVSSNMRSLVINEYSLNSFAREILKVLKQELSQ